MFFSFSHRIIIYRHTRKLLQYFSIHYGFENKNVCTKFLLPTLGSIFISILKEVKLRIKPTHTESDFSWKIKFHCSKSIFSGCNNSEYYLILIVKEI